MYFFEIYAEPHFNDRWSARIGRQGINYDNQRLFSESDWRLSGVSHDAVRLIYKSKTHFTTELTGAYNQSAENNFGSNYAPNGFKNYKDLVIHYLNWKPVDKWTITTLNTMDGYQSAQHYNTTFQRFTSGGRLAYQSNGWYATVSGYYQYGKDSAGKKLSAFYLQPEVKYSTTSFEARLGMEVLSGQDSARATDNNFAPLYGTGHRFNGMLDLFTTFSSDTRGSGLINPYLFFMYQIQKTTVRLENHLFYAQTGNAFNGLPTDKKYMGFESDVKLNFKINAFTELEYAFALASVTNSLIEVKSGAKTVADIDKYSKIPYYTSLSLRFTPVLGKFSF